MQVNNRTHYFNVLTRTQNTIVDNHSFAYESSQRLQLQQRLFWEMKDTEKHHGNVFFVTFTYNDDNIPKYNGVYPCFDYSHIRKLTNGLIQKELLRKYCSQVRYCIVPETGEGKGKRGYGNNPHLHAIFFVSPLRDKNNNPIYGKNVRINNKLVYVAYKPILSYEFVELCRKVWQYNKEDNKYIFKDYKDAKLGHVQPGLNNGLVTNGDPFGYVAKYVTKDNLRIGLEGYIKNYWNDSISKFGIDNNCIYNYYYYLREQGVTKQEFFDRLYLHDYNRWRQETTLSDKSYKNYYDLYLEYSDPYTYKELSQFFRDVYKPLAIKYWTRKDINQYVGKVRNSKTLGVYGLTQIQNEEQEPFFVICNSKRTMPQRISLYYYRKKYMQSFVCPETGNTLYRLNALGIIQRSNTIDRKIKVFHANLNYYLQHVSIDKYRNIYQVFFSSDELKRITSLVSDEYISKLYSVYSLVYAFRHYNIYHPIALTHELNINDVRADYKYILEQTAFVYDYQIGTLNELIYKERPLSFVTHPVFFAYHDDYRLLDRFVELSSKIISDTKRIEFANKREERKRIKHNKFNK